MLCLSHPLWLRTVWWHLSVFIVVGEQRLLFSSRLWLSVDKVAESSSVCWERDQGQGQTCIVCGRLSLFGLGWYRHFPVDVKGQLPRRVQVKFSLSVFLISSSIIPLLSFPAFVQYVTFSNSLVVLTRGSSLQIRIRELCQQNLTGLKMQKQKQWAKRC